MSSQHDLQQSPRCLWVSYRIGCYRAINHRDPVCLLMHPRFLAAMKLEPEAEQRVSYDDDDDGRQRYEGVPIMATGVVHAVLCSATWDPPL